MPTQAAERVHLDAEIHLRKSGYHKAAVDLLDLSPTGCRVELPERVAPGEKVWITFPGLEPIEATVAWCRDWVAGVQFARPIYPAVFELLVKRIKS